MSLTGNVALVTGASRGIGASVARALGAEGAAVAVNYHGSEAAAKAVVAEIRAAVVGILKAGFVTGATLPVNGGGYLF